MVSQKEIIHQHTWAAASRIQTVYLRYRLRKKILENYIIRQEKYYSPGNPGYYKAFENFESVYVNYMYS